jgi:xanthine dehydrogenase accessory factor
VGVEPTAGWCLRFHEELVRLLSAGERVAVATVVRGRGSRPRSAGAKMIVREDGRSLFSIGGGALEASVVASCREVLAGGPAKLERYELSESGEDSVGMTCGGTMEVFIELHEPPQRLVVFGAGHVGRSLAGAAAVAGLSLLVVDDRADWLEARAFPEGAALHRCGRDYASDLPSLREADCVAVMTRCHATDVSVLQAVARTRPRYVGMIGSKRKVVTAFEALEELGVERDWLESIHAPIGLDIGAQTPGEIGLAVAAEVVQVLRAEDS